MGEPRLTSRPSGARPLLTTRPMGPCRRLLAPRSTGPGWISCRPRRCSPTTTPGAPGTRLLFMHVDSPDPVLEVLDTVGFGDREAEPLPHAVSRAPPSPLHKPDVADPLREEQ